MIDVQVSCALVSPHFKVVCTAYIGYMSVAATESQWAVSGLGAGDGGGEETEQLLL